MLSSLTSCFACLLFASLLRLLGTTTVHPILPLPPPCWGWVLFFSVVSSPRGKFTVLKHFVETDFYDSFGAGPPLRLNSFCWLKLFPVEFELANQKELFYERTWRKDAQRTFPIT
jgi:hypothetical protein